MKIGHRSNRYLCFHHQTFRNTNLQINPFMKHGVPSDRRQIPGQFKQNATRKKIINPNQVLVLSLITQLREFPNRQLLKISFSLHHKPGKYKAVDDVSFCLLQEGYIPNLQTSAKTLMG